MTMSMDTPDLAKVSPTQHHLNSSALVNSEKSSKEPKEMVVGSFLGIDFGKAKVGLAIADEETRMAFAFDTLKNDKEFWKNLKEIVTCENVKIIVLGMTRHDKDDESAKEKLQFARMIQEQIGLEVAFQEEMFTTKMAHANIKLRGGKNIAKTDDQEAARIILQSWLDRQD